jgi:Ca2+/Na+ antiporter
MWTYIACDWLVEILNMYTAIFGLDETYMGLTILAVGNSLPDSLTTIQLAKIG